jgi:hypothetical protein
MASLISAYVYFIKILCLMASTYSLKVRLFLLQLITLNDTHTQTLGRTPLDEGSGRRRDLYLTINNIQNRQPNMPRLYSILQSNKQATADPRLRPRGYRHRPKRYLFFNAGSCLSRALLSYRR